MPKNLRIMRHTTKQFSCDTPEVFVSDGNLPYDPTGRLRLG
jgi:hypothetical protein